MKTLSVLILMSLVACSSDMEPLESIEWKDDGNAFPANSVWTVHTLKRTECDATPLPTRMQFSTTKWVDVMFSDGNDIETNWGILDTALVLTNEVRINAYISLESAVWHYDNSGYLVTTAHYYGTTSCEAELVAIRE